MHRARLVNVIRILIMTVFTAMGTQACAHLRPNDVAIDIVADNGSVLAQYPAPRTGISSSHRRYIEAHRNQRYGIRVRNRTNQRIGLVIAVDGRNIISGQKSYLKPNERMYILGPYEQATYTGWRTHQNQVHRFYFTDMKDSYAEAFGDHTAMGVIAVASYREKIHLQPLLKQKPQKRRFGHGEDAASEAEPSPGGAASPPGTGFGEEQWSPSHVVHFEPDARQAAKYFYKYEWRQTLCAKGIVACGRPENRFWPEERDNGYAPYPPPGKNS